MYDIESITLSSVKFKAPLVIFVDKKDGHTEYLEMYIKEGGQTFCI